MKLKALPFAAALCLLPATALAQSTAPAAPPAPPAPAQPAAPPAVADAPFGFAATLFAEGNFLGVRAEEVTRENMSRYGLSGEARGVGVREVVKGSPAERAGLREGDVILRLDGEPVTSVRKLTRLIQEAAPEHTARLTLRRGGSEQEVSVTLSRREPFAGAGGAMTVEPFAHGRLWDSDEWRRNEERMRRQFEEMGRNNPGFFAVASSRRIGVTTSSLGKQLADYFGVSHGVLINSVVDGSPAAKAGLRAGDVVIEADGRKVEDADDLVRALGAKEEGEVTLTVVRDRKERAVRVTPERRPSRGIPGPGSFRLIESPVAAVGLPGVVVDALPALAPRAVAVPRVRVAPGRVTVVRPGGRVL